MNQKNKEEENSHKRRGDEEDAGKNRGPKCKYEQRVAKATRRTVLIIIYIYLRLFSILILPRARTQPSAAWIVDQMVSASRENVDVIQASLEIYVINCHAIPVVPSMANAKTERAFARKDGTDAIVLCVSISLSHAHTYTPLSLSFFSVFFFFVNFILQTKHRVCSQRNRYENTRTTANYTQMKCHEFRF